ncbi:MAG: glycosyltransferase family 9 protein [Candidatus Omnitrophica bacterium]|nr:glycosyltransferase family 9 protein [Candidatus Omnitrophota bacterium]
MSKSISVKRRYVFKKRWKRVAVFLFDVLGSFLFLPFRLLKRKKPVSPKRILVIRVDSLGDGVLSLPAIDLLRKEYPSAQIDFLVSPHVQGLYSILFLTSKIYLYENNWLSSEASFSRKLLDFFGWIGRIWDGKYDLGIDFRGDLRNLVLLAFAGIPERWGREGAGGGFLLTKRITHPYTRHEILENLELVRQDESEIKAEFPKLSDALSEGRDIEKKLGVSSEKKKIVIHVGAGYPSKRWSARNFVQIANWIQDKQLGVPLFIGTDEERKLLEPFRENLGNGALNLIGRTSLSELLMVLKEADLFIGNDSGPAHLASLLDRKMVIIFSGTNEQKRWAPWSSKARIVSRPVPCSPCEERVCPLEKQYCLEDISAEQVFQVVEEVLRD